MRNRVEITGVDTSKLIAISNEETMRLLDLMKNGDKEARNKLILHNLRLVAHIVKKYDNKLEDFETIQKLKIGSAIKVIGKIIKYFYRMNKHFPWIFYMA